MQKEYSFRLHNKEEFLAELEKKNYGYDKKETKCVFKKYRRQELPLGWIFDNSDCPILLIRHLDGLDSKATIKASSNLVKLAEEF